MSGAGPEETPQAEASALQQEAVAVATEVAQSFPEDALTHALLGSAYYNTGRSADATTHLRKCLALNPDLADPYDILARIAYEKGELAETVSLCREALQRSPGNSEVLNRLGRALMDSGETDAAIRTLEQAANGPRPVSESFYLLGQAFLQSGEFARAKGAFQQTLERVPDHTQASFGLFTACARLGDAAEAERHRQRFVALESQDRKSLTDRSAQDDVRSGLPLVRQTVAQTLFGAAQIYRLHQQPELSARLLRRCATLDPLQVAYRAALEAHYVQRKALAEGIQAFSDLGREQPTNALNHLFLGRLHGRAQQFEPAERAYRRVQELAPDWVDGYRALAELYLLANREPAEALRLARRAVDLDPGPAGLHLLSLACLKNGDRAGALEAIRKAVELRPEEPRYREVLERLQATSPPAP